MEKKYRFTKKKYCEYLDELAPPYGDDRWIVGGVLRMYHMARKSWGKCLRQHDPIGFQVGYQDWVREEKTRLEKQK